MRHRSLPMLIALLTFVGTMTSSAQFTGVNLFKTRLAELVRSELLEGAQPQQTDEIFYSVDGAAQPLLFRSKEKGLPDRVSAYHFLQADSSLIFIEHEWDARSRSDRSAQTIPAEAKAALLAKYRMLHNDLTVYYGNSDNKTPLPDSLPAEPFNRQDIWYTGNGMQIQLYTTISDRYVQSGNLTIVPSYRIRLYIRKL